MRRIGKRVGLVAAAVVALTWAPAQAAREPGGATSGTLPFAGGPPAGFASWGQLMGVQQQLDAVADRVGVIDAAGLGGVVVAPESRRLTVYWKGTEPAALARERAQLPAGLALTVAPAAFAHRDLVKASAPLARMRGVTAIAPAVDGSGLKVSLDPATVAPATSGVAAADVASPALAATPVAAAVRAAAGPVPVRFDTAPRTIDLSRRNDSSPYHGGAEWWTYRTTCSTGFAVRKNTHFQWLLSAGHCGINGESATNGVDTYMGRIVWEDDVFDRLMIATERPSAGWIYDGGVGTGEFTKPVAGASHSYVGDWLCTSGAYSGAVCNVRVTATNVMAWSRYGLLLELVQAEQIDHYAAAGSGDSGGPVFSLTADASKVIAKGTISSGEGNAVTTCAGVQGRICSWRVYYVDVVNSLNAYGVTIITG